MFGIFSKNRTKTPKPEPRDPHKGLVEIAQRIRDGAPERERMYKQTRENMQETLRILRRED